MNPGWSAGLLDATHDAWIWCGVRCLTTGGRWVHQELHGLASDRVQALVRCTIARCRRDVRRGVIALRNARVLLDDPSAPRLDGVRGALAGAGGWLRGGADVAFDAADNSGIRRTRVELDGAPVHEDARACDFARPVPCPDGPAAAAFDTRAWADGEHRLRLGAQDAGGNWTWTERAVRVDNTPPPEPAPVLDGGAGWRPERTRTISVPLPPGQAAPLVRARVRACRAGGACTDAAAELRSAPAPESRAETSAEPRTAPRAETAAAQPTAAAAVTAFDGPGEYSVRVALEDAAGNIGPGAPPLALRFDDARPGAPDTSAADAWRNDAALPLATEGEPPVSGIAGYRVRIGGREAVVATALPLDALPEGGTAVEVRAVSGAGVESTAVRTMLKLDRSAPAVVADGAPAAGAWSRAPVRIGLRGRDQAGLSGVHSLNWRVDGAEETVAPGDEAAIEIAADGRHRVAYRAVDAAGNASAEQALAVHVDRTPPETVAFEAPDPADPRAVRVVVADATSGVARGRIELRRAGGPWRALATTLSGGRLVGAIDDDARRAGAYRLRAVVADAAGNEAVGTRRTDGAPAALSLPLRRPVALDVRRRGRTLHARLTAGGAALAARELTLAQRLRGRTRWRAVCGRRTVVIAAASRCALRTDRAGRIAVRLPAGPSRTLRVAFAGDALLLPARGTARVRTRARARLAASPGVVRAGAAVRLSGRLIGGHVPRAGKLVELQALVGAGWRTFATVRTGRRGRLRHRHRFATTSAGRTYRLRLRVPREAAYPFEAAVSRAVAVHVT